LEVVEAGTLYSYLPRYSTDGSPLATFGGDVRIHDSTTLTQLHELPCPTSLDFLPASVGTGPGRDHVWDVAAAERWDADTFTVLTSVSGPLLCDVIVSADGSRAVTVADVQGDGPGGSLLWDTSDGSLVAVIAGQSEGFSTDGSRLFMSNGPSFSIVDSSTGAVVRTITDDAIGSTVSSPDGSRLLRWGTTTKADGTGVDATIYDMQTLTPVATLSADSPDEIVGIEDPVFDDTSGRVAALHASGVTIWDASTGAEIRHIPVEFAVNGHHVAFSPDGAMIAVRNGSHITIFDPSAGVQLADLELGPDMIFSDVVFSADGVSLAAEVAGSVRVWSYVRTD
jgi:WD40 repeat protein